MKIAILENLGCSRELLDAKVNRLVKQGHEVHLCEHDSHAKSIETAVAQADVLMLANMPLSREVLDNAPNVKFIDVAFTGVDHIPLDLASKRGIIVSNASGYANDAVAELVVSQMIQLLRDLPKAEEKLRNGGVKTGLRANLLRNKTVGIIGAGAIGMTIARLCKAFGAKIIVHNRHEVKDAAIDANASLDELLSQSDIVTLNCPLTPETRHIIGENELAKMQRNAFLINTARGGVVDNEALANALNAGIIAGAAIDVFDMEPPLPSNYPLLQAKNAILTPHLGFYTEEALNQRAETAFANLDAWLAGKPINVI